MLDAIYALPIWALGALVVGLAIALSALGLLVVHRAVPADVRRAHNDIAGYISNIAAFAYAVTLAFLAVGVWEDYGKAELAVQLEANSASDVFRGAAGYPEPLRGQVRDGIRAYVETLIQEEWPLQARGRLSAGAWQALDGIYRRMLAFEPRGAREEIIHRESLGHVNRLMDQRRLRIQLGSAGLHVVVWAVILLGSGLTVGFSWLMGAPNVRVHFAMTMALGAIIGLSLFLLIALDYPFRGGAAIRPEAFEAIRAEMGRVGG